MSRIGVQFSPRLRCKGGLKGFFAGSADVFGGRLEGVCDEGRSGHGEGGMSRPRAAEQDVAPAESDDAKGAEIRAQEQIRTKDDGDQGVGLGAPDGGDSDGDDRIQEAMDEAAAVAEETGGLGEPGRPINKRSPFMIGLMAAFGVAVAYGLIELIIKSRSMLIIVGLALFIAAGLDPIVGWLVRHRFPRWAAVLTVIIVGLGIVAAFLAAAIPPLTHETTSLANQVPHYIADLKDRSSELGKLNAKYDIQSRLTKALSSGGTSLIGGVLGAGELVLSTFSEILAVAVLS